MATPFSIVIQERTPRTEAEKENSEESKEMNNGSNSEGTLNVPAEHEAPPKFTRLFSFETDTTKYNINPNETPYHLQGDQTMYTKSALDARKQLRHHPSIVACIDQFWMTRHNLVTGAESKISVNASKQNYEEYEYLYLAMKKALYGTLTLPEDKHAAAAEWQNDTRGTGALNHTRFADSLFELADIWTSTVHVGDYVYFLSTLYERITVELPVSPALKRTALFLPGDSKSKAASRAGSKAPSRVVSRAPSRAASRASSPTEGRSRAGSPVRSRRPSYTQLPTRMFRRLEEIEMLHMSELQRIAHSTAVSRRNSFTESLVEELEKQKKVALAALAEAVKKGTDVEAVQKCIDKACELGLEECEAVQKAVKQLPLMQKQLECTQAVQQLHNACVSADFKLLKAALRRAVATQTSKVLSHTTFQRCKELMCSLLPDLIIATIHKLHDALDHAEYYTLKQAVEQANLIGLAEHHMEAPPTVEHLSELCCDSATHSLVARCIAAMQDIPEHVKQMLHYIEQHAHTKDYDTLHHVQSMAEDVAPSTLQQQITLELTQLRPLLINKLFNALHHAVLRSDYFALHEQVNSASRFAAELPPKTVVLLSRAQSMLTALPVSVVPILTHYAACLDQHHFTPLREALEAAVRDGHEQHFIVKAAEKAYEKQLRKHQKMYHDELHKLLGKLPTVGSELYYAALHGSFPALKVALDHMHDVQLSSDALVSQGNTLLTCIAPETQQLLQTLQAASAMKTFNYPALHRAYQQLSTITPPISSHPLYLQAGLLLQGFEPIMKRQYLHALSAAMTAKDIAEVERLIQKGIRYELQDAMIGQAQQWCTSYKLLHSDAARSRIHSAATSPRLTGTSMPKAPRSGTGTPVHHGHRSSLSINSLSLSPAALPVNRSAANSRRNSVTAVGAAAATGTKMPAIGNGSNTNSRLHSRKNSIAHSTVTAAALGMSPPAGSRSVLTSPLLSPAMNPLSPNMIAMSPTRASPSSAAAPLSSPLQQLRLHKMRAVSDNSAIEHNMHITAGVRSGTASRGEPLTAAHAAAAQTALLTLALPASAVSPPLMAPALPSGRKVNVEDDGVIFISPNLQKSLPTLSTSASHSESATPGNNGRAILNPINDGLVKHELLLAGPALGVAAPPAPSLSAAASPRTKLATHTVSTADATSQQQPQPPSTASKKASAAATPARLTRPTSPLPPVKLNSARKHADTPTAQQ